LDTITNTTLLSMEGISKVFPGVVARWIFEVKDFIRFKLTGEAFAETTDYSGSNLMNIKDVCFDRELLKEYGLEELYDA